MEVKTVVEEERYREKFKTIIKDEEFLKQCQFFFNQLKQAVRIDSNEDGLTLTQIPKETESNPFSGLRADDTENLFHN